MNANFSQEMLLGDVCNLYLVDYNTKSRCACHNIYVIRLEADTSMIDALATGIPLLEDSDSPNANSSVNPYTIRYPPNSTIGYGYFILREYHNNLSRTPCLFF